MTLDPGTWLGPYQIEGRLGAGGMGEVYRGRDIRLDRPVAIKVLSSVLSETPALAERFEREARLLSSLNHPHICVVYDVGQALGISYIVMELLEGETLAARVARGPLPVHQATSIALQIASALERAHRVGVIHRDVKPENVMLTKAGAKLLDFGLAKPTPIAADVASPTQSLKATGQGTILGTIHYMAPEQLEGRPADARSDIFAFGAVLYEMVTGHRPFSGDSAVTVISSILRDTPRPIAELQPFVPAGLDGLVRTCLEKDPEDRWHDVHDVASQLRWLQQSGSQSGAMPAPAGVRKKRIERAAWASAVVLSLGVAGIPWYLAPALPEEPIQFSIREPAGAKFNPRSFVSPVPAISPDGRHVVFGALVDETSVLYIRSLDGTTIRQLPGTEGAWLPFWSPDSRHIGFHANGALKRTSILSGGVQVICMSDGFEGGTWSADDVVLFSRKPGLFRVDAQGGEPVAVTVLDESKGETFHRAPVFLPDGKHFLYLSQPGNHVVFGSLDGGAPRRLLTADARALFAPPGHLLFATKGVLYAQAFNPKRGELDGDPLRIAESVRSNVTSGRAAFSVSESGVLVYRSGESHSTSAIRWIDRSGQRREIVLDAAEYEGIALSPDARYVAFHRHEDDAGGGGISIKDLQRGDVTRVTSTPSHNTDPVWNPDGTRIAFTSNRTRRSDIFVKPPSRTGSDEILLQSSEEKSFVSWSTDQRYLIYQVQAGTQNDIWVWSAENGSQPYINSPVDEIQPMFSPNGKWVAYSSFETGRFEVYVQPFPATGERFSISRGSGGIQPRWRKDGRELFYLMLDGTLKSVAVDPAAPGSGSAAPQKLFQVDIAGLSTDAALYQPTADGKRFLFAEQWSRSDTSSAEPLTVVINWLKTLGRTN